MPVGTYGYLSLELMTCPTNFKGDDEIKSVCNPCFDDEHELCVDKRCQCNCKPRGDDEIEKKTKKEELEKLLNSSTARCVTPTHSVFGAMARTHVEG